MSNKVEIIIGAKDQFSKIFGLLHGTLGTIGTATKVAGVAVAGYTAAMLANTKAVAENYDKIQKLSDQLGVSTEFLSKYAVAADFSGIQTETFNKAIQMLQVRVGEAARGIGMGKDAFEALDINIEKANGTLKTSEEILPELAEAFHNMTNATERAEAASKIFGQRGMSMLQMFKDGKEGLSEMTAEAERFGLVVSAKAGANAAEFNDMLTRVRGSITGLRNYFAETMMPTLTDLGNKFADLVADNRPAIIEFSKTFATSMGYIAEMGLMATASLIDGWQGVRSTYQRVRAAMLKDEALWIKAQIELRERAIKGRQKGLDPDTDLLIARNEEALKQLYQQLRDISGAAADAYNTMADIGDNSKAVESIQTLVANIRGALSDLGKPQGEDGGLLKDVIGDTDGALEQIQTVESAYRDFYNSIYALEEEKRSEFQAARQKEIDEEKEKLEALKKIYDEYRLSDSEALEEWYIEQQELYGEHKEALAMLDEIYTARQKDIADKEKQYKDKSRQQDLKNAQGAMKNLQSLAKAGGKQGFEAFKALQIAEATITGIQAAMSAFQAGMSIGTPAAPAFAAIYAAASIAWTAAQIAAISSQNYQAHSGLTIVPQTGPYTLQQGERVLSTEQNQDLTSALKGGGMGSGLYIENVYIDLSGSVTAESLMDISKSDWVEIGQLRVLPALQELAAGGFKV